MQIEIITLFPEFFASALGATILKRAQQCGQLRVSYRDVRDYTHDWHRTVDDTPYGGGSGMVMKVEPLVAAIEDARAQLPGARVVMMTPQGQRFDQARAQAYSELESLVLICGRYEGFDDRVRAFVDEELCIGDFVLSGGEPAALIVTDAVARLLPGVLGNADSTQSESFAPDADGLLEYPQYTRPRSFRGMEVPGVLLSGDHGAVERWRREQSVSRTRARRPELFDAAPGEDPI